MYKLLLQLLLTISLTLVANSNGQTPDGFDTLICRSNKMVLIPTYDSIKQLKMANEQADSILRNLELIKIALNINDSIE